MSMTSIERDRDEGTHTLPNPNVPRGPARVRVVSTRGEPVLGGRARGLGATPILVGASSSADLVVEDAAVSRRHLTLAVVNGGVHVHDLGSHNGTFYLDQRIESAIVDTGTLLRIGTTTLAIEVDGAPANECPAGFRGMIGASPAMQRLFAAIARLDATLLPVLVRGETGVGKELVARAIHDGSRVAGGPFVPINCGALPRELVASTLFGHKRGAFTGATDPRRGAFGAADGGTLLLDEIGELPLDLQPALLRALEYGEVTPVGEDVPRNVRVRILAATHRDLVADVRAGRFREDLYYRLACLSLDVPPLRDRRDDIPMLAEMFARDAGAAGLGAELVDTLLDRPFPGNVRELRAAVVAFLTLGSSSGTYASTAHPHAHAAAVSAEPTLDTPFLEQRDALVDRFTEMYLDKLLAAANGNQTVAAKLAGLDRTYLGRLLQRRR